MDKQIIILQTCEFVKTELAQAEAGHDWSHIERVWKNAKKIAAKENVDLFTVELAALFHDIADSKFHDGNENIGPEKICSCYIPLVEFRIPLPKHIRDIQHVY